MADYTFGVVPQQSSRTLARAWLPILDRVYKQTGIRLHFRTAPSIPEFENRLATGEYDFAYMNPYQYVVYNNSPGYKAFMKEKDKKLVGIIVVNKNSSIKDISELNGKVIAFPSPSAFAASMIPQSNLEQLGIQFRPAYVKSHDSVYRNVLYNRYLAGAGVKRTLYTMPENVRSQLRILWTSKGYTPHAFAALPRIPQAHVEKVVHFMTTMHNQQDYLELLNRLEFKALEIATDSDWDDIRNLSIKLQ